METSTNPPELSVKKSDRIILIDALRGFALAGIVFTHMFEHYMASPIPVENAEMINPGLIDEILRGLCDFLLRGKFFALFSFLFGFSFFIQMDKGSQKGDYYGLTFLRRILILLGIGFLHSCLYRGDILLIYALLAIPLIPFHKASSRWVWAFILLIFLGVPRYLVFYFKGGAPLILDYILMPDSPAIAEYFKILQTGDPMTVVVANAWEGILFKFEFQWGVISRGYLTFAFFLLGLWAGRTGWFRDYIFQKPRFKRGWIIGLTLMIINSVAAGFIFDSVGDFNGFNSWVLMLGLTAWDLANLGMTLLYISLFVLAFATPKGERRLSVFVPYGKMALTNYLLQSALGSMVYYGWGLGFVGTLPTRYSFLLAIALIVFQMWLSALWLKYFRYGPIEWLWRSLTHFKRYPLRFNE